ncbi:GntR family transcriptional regulator [Streptosporangium roseum]|uniref:GntR family transcriptional regulator n=1 Tax=Streptosporangium roseum TaxID=2001 RepID=UPI0033167E06
MRAATSRWLTGGLVYRQLADRIRAQITAGEYPRGSTLPSEPALAEHFRVARSTVRRGLAVLEGEGLITALPGRGRVVNDPDQETGPAYRYQVIANDLREQIRTGALVAGARLPSEMALRRHHGASRNTVRQALDELRHEGLIVTAHGKGRFVRFAPD